jgi:hypothetical protein
LGIAAMPAKDKEKMCARMAASLEDLRYYKNRKREEIGRPANRQVIDTDDRRAVENAFILVTGDTPRLGNQRSPNMLGKLMTAAAEGRINTLEIKDLVPYHPAPWVRLAEAWKIGPDGKMALAKKKKNSASADNRLPLERHDEAVVHHPHDGNFGQLPPALPQSRQGMVE